MGTHSQVVNEGGDATPTPEPSTFHHSNWLDNDTPSVTLWRNNPPTEYKVCSCSVGVAVVAT